MAVYEYADQFERQLAQKYERELVSYELTQSNPGIKFMNAQTIKIPRLTVSSVTRTITELIWDLILKVVVSNDWEPKAHPCWWDIEFAIDPMDVDETNLVTEIANIQNVFEEEQAIPEKDSYRFSKLLTEATSYTSKGGCG